MISSSDVFGLSYFMIKYNDVSCFFILFYCSCCLLNASTLCWLGTSEHLPMLPVWRVLILSQNSSHIFWLVLVFQCGVIEILNLQIQIGINSHLMDEAEEMP